MGNTATGQQGFGRPTSACSHCQAMDHIYSTSRRWMQYSDYPYPQGSERPTSRYSYHAGEGLGSYTHTSQAGNRYIGRIRLAEQFLNVRFPMSKITVPALGKVLIAECGNEGRHPYLSPEEKATLQFLRAAISFVPLALKAGADMENASFLFAQPGKEFAVVAGKGGWEFYFYLDSRGDISGHCIRRPQLRYIWDGVKSTFRRVASFLSPIFRHSLLAITTCAACAACVA